MYGLSCFYFSFPLFNPVFPLLVAFSGMLGYYFFGGRERRDVIGERRGWGFVNVIYIYMYLLVWFSLLSCFCNSFVVLFLFLLLVVYADE